MNLEPNVKVSSGQELCLIRRKDTSKRRTASETLERLCNDRNNQYGTGEKKYDGTGPHRGGWKIAKEWNLHSLGRSSSPSRSE